MTTWLHKAAEDLGMPLRTLEQVKPGLLRARRDGGEAEMARLMLRHGRLTDEARDYIARKYPQ